MNKNEFKWGIGIEHEMHLFHIPKNEAFDSIIAFDGNSALQRLLTAHKSKKIQLTNSELEFLKTIPFEISGRTCNGIKIINKLPINMPELITAYPFCSVQRDRTKRAIEDIYEYKIKLIKLLKKDNLTKDLIKKYGDINEYPYGMSRYIKYGKIKNKNYEFNKNSKKEDILYTDYTGSYHVTLTLPHTDETTNEEFIEMHKNFCNQLQWIEPLLLIGYFSGDEYSPGSKYNRVRGSYRIMNLGWGNMAGSDIRLFEEGIGRYAKTKIYWREKFLLHETKKLKPCIKSSPYAKKEGGLTSYGSDLRTFGENEKGIRVSGYKMMKPNGIEIRIFDNFESRYLKNLMFFLFLLIENSFQTKTKDYVYENKTWIKNIREIMKYGYTANIDKSYIHLINKKLNIKIIEKENENLYNSLLKALYKKNKNGFYLNLLSPYNYKYIQIENYFMRINQLSWECSFLLKMVNNYKVLIKYNQILRIIEYIENLNKVEFEKIVLMILGNNWKYDIKNILIFLSETRFILIKNNKISINKNRIYEQINSENIFELLKYYFNVNTYSTFVSNSTITQNMIMKIFNNENI